MNSTLYIFVNGILTNPEDIQGWTDRAEIWIDTHTPDKATKMEYRSGALTRMWYQNERINNLKKLCRSYNADKVVLVGHSNGCDIIQKMIKKSNIKIHEAHLIAGASEHDFKKNGLSKALKSGQLGKVFIYVSPIDEALKRAKWTRGLLKYIGLGYGYLGLVGPDNVDIDISNRVVLYIESFSHSQWFSKKNFEHTMQCIAHRP